VRTFWKTSRSASRYCASSSGPGAAPSRRLRETVSPTPMAQEKSAALRPPASVAACTTLAWTFSKMRGTAQTKVGLKRPRFSTSRSMRPSTTVGKPMRSWAVPIILPKLWASGSQKSWEQSWWSRMPDSSMAADCSTQQAWVSSTPLGGPVVPEV
jgi:hypothetical protein